MLIYYILMVIFEGYHYVFFLLFFLLQIYKVLFQIGHFICLYDVRNVFCLFIRCKLLNIKISIRIK